MIAAGTQAILIGWGASRVWFSKGELKRNKEDKLQVLQMTGVSPLLIKIPKN